MATGYLPPVTAGVEYFNFFNSEDSLTRNLIPNKPTPAKNGSPLFNTNGQSFLLTNLLNFINTGIKLTDEMTIITVAEPTGADGNFPDLVHYRFADYKWRELHVTILYASERHHAKPNAIAELFH
ncbi:hypothetical protein LNO55_17880 [Klebsiella pneumoniae subsp. pneumoniae]|nr:hypothetical protein [Klebsiella pneumoniae subsp. pneumoniae]